MKISLKVAFATALALASLPSVPLSAAAHDRYGHSAHRHSYENYRAPYSGYSPVRDRYYRDYYSRGAGERNWKYNKAMRRLSRQEREARMKAYRRFEGNRSNPRYQQRLSEIERKYDHKRYKVDRNFRRSW